MALTDKLSAIGEAIRAKTGKSDLLTLDEMPTEIASISGSGSGGSAEGCVTVTFMNGDTVLFSRPVYIGDDCPDPVDQGRIETPTKESTVQYDYTYYGWGAEDNGAADSTILENITEDKTVYAIFSAKLRSYTITYLDDDGSVLYEDTLLYGATPTSYEPTKSGYLFSGWSPAITTVTGDISYIAQWEELTGEAWGDYCAWSLRDGVLTITGSGDMPDYAYNTYTERPWETQINYITSIVIESGVTNIGQYAFRGMTEVTDIEIPDSVTSIGASAFYGCTGITSLTISESVTSIGASAFTGSGITSLTIPDSVTSIGTCANATNLISVVIGNGVTSISSFENCTNLKSVVIGSGVTQITGFSGCTNLTSVNIGSGATYISANAFYNCSQLANITIPGSVTGISKNAFYLCSGLSSVTFEDTSGWYVSTSSSATSGTNLTLTDPSTNATYLKSTYRTYFWKKS